MKKYVSFLQKIVNSERSLWVIILLSTIARCYRITDPLTFEHDWNTAIWSIIARNIVLHGRYAPLYLNHPPLVIFLEVVSFKIFGIQEFAARIIPVLCSALSVFYFYKMIARISRHREVAFWSSLIMAFLPITLYFGRMLNHEPVITLFMIAAVYYYILYCQDTRKKYLYLSFVSFFLLCWTDVYGILILLPLLYLSLRGRLKEFLIFILITIVSFSSWVLIINLKGQLPRLLGAAQHWSECFAPFFKSSQFWETIFLRRLPDLYTPVIMVFFVFSCLYFLKHHKVILFWLIGSVLLFLTVPRWFHTHNYALYYFVPPVAAMVGWLFKEMGKCRRIQLFVLILFLGFSLSLTKEKFDTYDHSLYEAAEWIRKNSLSNEQVAIVGSYYIQHTPLEFYSRRNVIPQLAEEIELIKGYKEVRYIITGGLKSELFGKYMNDTYRMKSIGRYSIYDLKAE